MLKKRGKSGALEISFGWLFAIIAGAIIIFFAIYFSVKLMGTEQEAKDAQTGKEIGILLNPLETGFESSQTTSITMPIETRINNGCEDDTGNFGRQVIQLDQKDLGKWSKTDVNVYFNNKYIFSSSQIEGKKFYIFSKPLYFPFKIADLFYMTPSTKRYCFMNSPYEIEDEILSLNQSNLITENCTSSDITVCFGSNNCDVNVDYDSRIVEKDGEEVYFAGTREDSTVLMYAAIFSDKAVYECQVKRLMMRLEQLSLLYWDKEILNSNKGCGGDMGIELSALNDMTSSYAGSSELENVKTIVDTIDQGNNGAVCMLW